MILEKWERKCAMIEVLFAESEAASMKVAKSTVIYSKTDGPTSVFIAGKKKPPEKKHSGWIEGTRDGVVCLCYMLDIGDIQKDFESQYRKELIFSLLNQEISGEEKNYIDSNMQMQQLKEHLEAGEAIRIWYSDAPYSRCGLYHLCSILKQYENEIHLVKLPEHVVRGKTITLYKNWSEVAAEEFAGFLSGECS